MTLKPWHVFVILTAILGLTVALAWSATRKPYAGLVCFPTSQAAPVIDVRNSMKDLI